MMVDDPRSTDRLVLGAGPWTAALRDDFAQLWRSEAVADRQALLWSMELDDPGDPHAVPYPEVTTASLRPLRIEVTDMSSRPARSATHERHFLAPGVTRHRAPGLVADVFLPPGPGPHPGVLVLGGSSGGLGWSAQVAALLAGHGYAGMALAYFDWTGDHGLPTSISEIPVETALRAVRTLPEQATVSPDGVAVVAASRGTELALLTTLAVPTLVRGLVLFSPSAYVWEAARTDPASSRRSSWTLHGHPLPFLPLELDEEFYTTFDKTRLRRFHEDSIALHPDAAAVSRLPVETVRVPTLLLSGGQDGVWPSADMASTVSTAMRLGGDRNQREGVVTHLNFPAAGHFLNPPGLPCSPPDGDRAATAEANRLSWNALLTHLQTCWGGSHRPARSYDGHLGDCPWPDP